MDELGSPLSPFPLGTCKASQSVLDVITDLETNIKNSQWPNPRHSFLSLFPDPYGFVGSTSSCHLDLTQEKWMSSTTQGSHGFPVFPYAGCFLQIPL